MLKAVPYLTKKRAGGGSSHLKLKVRVLTCCVRLAAVLAAAKLATEELTTEGLTTEDLNTEDLTTEDLHHEGSYHGGTYRGESDTDRSRAAVISAYSEDKELKLNQTGGEGGCRASLRWVRLKQKGGGQFRTLFPTCIG